MLSLMHKNDARFCTTMHGQMLIRNEENTNAYKVQELLPEGHQKGG